MSAIQKCTSISTQYTIVYRPISCDCHGSALVGCRVGAAVCKAPLADAAGGRLVLVVRSLFEAAVAGLEAPPSGGRAPFTGGVPGLLVA